MAESQAKQPDPSQAPEHQWQDAPLACQGCVAWVQFKKDCWYFWEGKKHCTMWTAGIEQAPTPQQQQQPHLQ